MLAGGVVVQVLIVACGASRQSTGCFATPSSSATTTTLVENRFIVLANEVNARAAGVPSRPGKGAGQQPAISVTSGRRPFAWSTAHWYHAWQARMRSAGVPW